MLTFTELITHPALVNIESISIAELQTDSKLFRVIFLILTAPIPKNFLTFHSEPNFESHFCSKSCNCQRYVQIFLHCIFRLELYCHLVFCLIVIHVSDDLNCTTILQQ